MTDTTVAAAWNDFAAKHLSTAPRLFRGELERVFYAGAWATLHAIGKGSELDSMQDAYKRLRAECMTHWKDTNE